MALPAMAKSLAERGIQIDVATTDDDGMGRRLSGVAHGGPQERDGFRVFYFPKQTEFYKVSLPMFLWLMRHAGDYDLVHVHTVFSFSTLAAGWSASLRGVPFIVRPLGVLNSWGMNNRRRWIKAWSFRLLDRPVLNLASAMHYTSNQERDDAARLCLKAFPAVVPLGIDLLPFDRLPDATLFLEQHPLIAGRPIVLFLSRLDRKKNVELLLEAFARVATFACLVIAGSGEEEYVQGLEERTHQPDLAGRVVWAGYLSGQTKLAALAAATIFVLPSESENFGIALLEAMASGLPCISTSGVALAAESASAVLLTPTDPQALAAAITRLLADPVERKRLGNTARQCAQEQYSLAAMSRNLTKLYQTVLSKTALC
jgi:glycosyltransferase involved in cell wall biosynthesis